MKNGGSFHFATGQRLQRLTATRLPEKVVGRERLHDILTLGRSSRWTMGEPWRFLDISIVFNEYLSYSMMCIYIYIIFNDSAPNTFWERILTPKTAPNTVSEGVWSCLDSIQWVSILYDTLWMFMDVVDISMSILWVSVVTWAGKSSGLQLVPKETWANCDLKLNMITGASSSDN